VDAPANDTLYQRLLGSSFSYLHPILRRFHSCPEGAKAVGRFQVVRYPGRIRRLLADLIRLPHSGSTDVRLVVAPYTDGECWVRSFGPATIVTFQSTAASLLVERHGVVSFGLGVAVVDGGMVFQTRRVWFFGVPLPYSLRPSILATVVPDERGWSLSVRLTVPWIGHLLQYRGEVSPQWK
jgi:Domain of unknown function (DUF4166)